jgi:uncharacterized membrane protein
MAGKSNAAARAPAIRGRRGLIEYTYLIYALYALTVICAFLTVSVPVLRFTFALPSAIGICLNYLRRADAQGSWLESHFSWQSRTFWYALLWSGVAAIVAIPLLLLVHFWVSLVAFALIVLWVLYRVVRGCVALRESRPAPPSMV